MNLSAGTAKTKKNKEKRKSEVETARIRETRGALTPIDSFPSGVNVMEDPRVERNAPE